MSEIEIVKGLGKMLKTDIDNILPLLEKMKSDIEKQEKEIEKLQSKIK